MRRAIEYRKVPYAMLSGSGLEIGALHEPAELGSTCRVLYFDVRTRSELIDLFPEIDSSKVVEVDYMGDLDKRGLRELGAERFDFLVANHVIEHLANPIGFLEDAFRSIKTGGLIAISVPDKRFTFDINRELTEFSSLVDIYKSNSEDDREDSYRDFVVKVLPESKGVSDHEFGKLLALVRERREHVNVWDTAAFVLFLEKAANLLGVRYDVEFEKTGDETMFEYFCLLRKVRPSVFRSFTRFLRRNPS